MDKLGKRSRQVYDFIVSYKRQHDGCAPTIREIADACGVSSTNTAHYHLLRLERAGLIERPFYVTRFIKVKGGRWTFEPTK